MESEWILGRLAEGVGEPTFKKYHENFIETIRIIDKKQELSQFRALDSRFEGSTIIRHLQMLL
jgi:hypothetical protein